MTPRWQSRCGRGTVGDMGCKRCESGDKATVEDFGGDVGPATGHWGGVDDPVPPTFYVCDPSLYPVFEGLPDNGTVGFLRPETVPHWLPRGDE